MTFEGNVPEVVRRMSWNEYSVCISSPDNFVEVLVIGEGIAASRWPLRYMSSERNFAVARLIEGHSSVTDV